MALPKGVLFTEEQDEYFFALIELFLKERLPNLKDQPEKVPPRPRTGSQQDIARR